MKVTAAPDRTGAAVSSPAAGSTPRLLWRVARNGGRLAPLLPVTALAIAVAETVLPAALGRALDAMTGKAPAVWLTRCAWLIGVLAACDVLDDIAVGASTARATQWLRRSLVRRLLALGPRTLESYTPGDLANRVVTNAAGAGSIAADATRIAANLIPALGGSVALALIDPWLCVTFLVGFPILVFTVRTFFRESSEAAARYLDAQGTIAGRLVDALAGIRTIAAAGSVDREVGRVLAPLPRLHAAGLGMWRAQARVSVKSAVLVPVMELLVLAVAGVQLAHGQITPGELLAAGQYVLLATTLGSAVTSVARLVKVKASADRAAEIVATPPPVFGNRCLPGDGMGALELDGVTVEGSHGRILDGVTAAIPPGALVAVVGSSGAGKSTLAAAVARLLDPDAGEVRLDGVPLRELGQRELRAAVTYGFERPWLGGETVADAIAFGAERPTASSIRAAAVAAEADAFIRRLPEGYDSPLAHAPMSGGERQRVGLARAFAHAGRVLVLDDVGASLDTVTEHRIREVLTGELADRTRILVAHRAATAACADLVIWLEKGRVRGIGTHRELWFNRDYRAVFRPEMSVAEPILTTQ